MNTSENNHVDDRHPDMPAMQSFDCIPTGFDSMCSLRVRGVIQGGLCDRHDFLQTNTPKHPGTDVPDYGLSHSQFADDQTGCQRPNFRPRTIMHHERFHR